MVDTIKFSQMTNAGNINNNDIMPSLRTGENVILNNPWTFLAPGTTAQRPAPSTIINYRLRFNTDDQLYEYYDAVLGAWTQLQEDPISINGPFIIYTANASIPDAQNLGILSDGILAQTISSGIATINILGIPLTGFFGGTGVNNGASTITIGGNLQFAGAFGFIGNLTADTNVTFPPSGTLATTDLIPSFPLSMANGGTGAALSPANGAMPYSGASTMALLAPGATGQLFQSGGVGTPNWTTATFPATASTSGNVLVSDGTNWSSSSVTLITALGAQSQALNMNSHLINNVVDPVVAQDAATKNYVDMNALTGTSAYAATTTTLNATQSGAGVGATLTDASGTFAAFAVDGVSVPLGQRVLDKNQTNTANQGLYTLTRNGDGVSIPWQLTRSTTYDTPTEINNTGLIVIQNGTQAGQFYYNASTIVTVDTTAFNYIKAGPGGTVTSVASGTGLTGGPITTSGTLSFAAIAAHSLWANTTASSAVPTVIGTNTFLQTLNVLVFNTGTSTYTPSTGMKYCSVQIVGGGGSGGGVAGAASQGAAGGGGGGGGYCQKIYTAANIGASATIVVGTGGAAPTAGNNNGNAGGTSTFTCSGTGTTLTSAGGGGGGGAAASAVAGFTGAAANGGNASGGDISLNGGDGGDSWWLAAGALASGGLGGFSFLSTTTRHVVTNLGNGTAGFNGYLYGGGGSGALVCAAGNFAGGAGANGVCIVTEYIAV